MANLSHQLKQLNHFPEKVKQQLLFIEKEYNHRKDSWNIPYDEGIFLNLLVKTKKPKTILEIGTSYGYSTVFFAEAAAKVGAKLITVDINPEKTKIARENIEKAGLSSVVEFVTNDANIALKELLAKGVKPDFIFLDAKKTDYLQQFMLLEKSVLQPCVIAADNAIDLAENMKDFLDYLQQNSQLLHVIVPIGNGIALCYLE